MNTLVLAGALAAPPLLSKYSSGSFTKAVDARNVALGTAAVTGLLYMLTGSSVAGAVALGTGASGLLMLAGQKFKAAP